jgi:ABC-type sugar transport system ATPase subunit
MDSTIKDDQGGRQPPLVRFCGITKAYASSVVLDDVSFQMSRGSIHGLVGENGAGKSTLIKLMTGAAGITRGSFTFGGDEFTELNPSIAREAGIRVVPQERQVCADQFVLENILLGRMPRRFGGWGPVDWKEAAREAAARLAELGLDIDPFARVRDLSASEVQFVEVARVLSANAKLVIMDEPTAALSREEVAALSVVMRRLKERGVTILYVSHHLEEIFELADTVTVLRNGRHVETRAVEGLEMSDLIRLMIGYNPDASKFHAAKGTATDEPYLRVRGVSFRNAVHDVSLEVAPGEIVAVTGGLGSGIADLVKCVIGAVEPDDGTVEVTGQGVIKAPSDAVSKGVAFVTGDRKRAGILPTRDVIDNVDVAWLASRKGFINMPGRRVRAGAQTVSSLNVVCPTIFGPIIYLSGGNQQKVLLGRWMTMGMRCLVLEDPTEGVDIGSRFEIYEVLRSLTAQGLAVLMFTADLEEIELVADRAYVMRDGAIVGNAVAPDITAHGLLEIQYASKHVIRGGTGV